MGVGVFVAGFSKVIIVSLVFLSAGIEKVCVTVVVLCAGFVVMVFCEISEGGGGGVEVTCSVGDRCSGILNGIPGGGGGFFLANSCMSSAADGALAAGSFCGAVVALLNSSWDNLVILWTFCIFGLPLRWHK